MNDFLTKEVELCGSNMSQQDSDAIGEIIYEALMGRGIFCESLSWGINVEYFPQENDDEDWENQKNTGVWCKG